MTFVTKWDKELSLWTATKDGTPVLEYVYGEVDDTNPSFRVVKTLSGTDIVMYRPWDHPWHPGLFFSWKYINGMNFWEAKYHGQPHVVRTETFEPEGEAGFHQLLSYITDAGETLVREERQVSIEAADEGYVIRWKAVHQSVGNEDVTLDRTVITEQSPWGGYAGLSCRLARNYLGPTITTDKGVFAPEEAFAKPFRWCDYAGKLDGYIKPTWAGICLFDFPSNPRFPTHVLTYDYKDMQFMQAALLCHEPYILKAGEPLELEYAFYVHDGQVSADKLEHVWQGVTGR